MTISSMLGGLGTGLQGLHNRIQSHPLGNQMMMQIGANLQSGQPMSSGIGSMMQGQQEGALQKAKLLLALEQQKKQMQAEQQRQQFLQQVMSGGVNLEEMMRTPQGLLALTQMGVDPGDITPRLPSLHQFNVGGDRVTFERDPFSGDLSERFRGPRRLAGGGGTPQADPFEYDADELLSDPEYTEQAAPEPEQQGWIGSAVDAVKGWFTGDEVAEDRPLSPSEQSIAETLTLYRDGGETEMFEDLLQKLREGGMSEQRIQRLLSAI